MRLNRLHIFIALLASLGQAVPLLAAESQRYYQLVLPFDSSKVYSYTHKAEINTVELEIRGVSASQIAHLDHYDERLIRRIIVRDAAGEATYVRFFLRDDNVRLSIAHFDEPFRITLDFYDANFREQRDTETGMPVIAPKASSTLEATKPSSSLSAPSGEPRTSDNTLRRSFQAPARTVKSPEQLRADLSDVSGGLATGWESYPLYVYRLENLPFEDDRTHARWISRFDEDALPPAVAMASYASQLFDFGHENRALIAYQQVLQQDPLIFDHSPIHLWKFAEAHLAQGNLTLADGYYDALINKHAESGLASFAQLRRLDIRAIRLGNQNRHDGLVQLVPPLREIRSTSDTELQSLLGIRQAFWGSPQSQVEQQLPEITQDTYASLSANQTESSSQRTKFLSASLQLQHLIDSARQWGKPQFDFATHYFSTYRGQAAEPYRSLLSEQLRERLKEDFRELFGEESYTSIIQKFEALPSSLQSIRKDALVAWAIAESYHHAGQFSLAIPFYKEVTTQTSSEVDRFRAQFWKATMAGRLGNTGDNANAAEGHRQTMRRSDQAMKASWERMTNEEKNELLAAFRAPLETSIKDSILLSTPAEIIFESWSKAFSTDSSAATTNIGNISELHSTTTQAVYFLRDLASRFSELGQQQRRRDTLAIMQHLRPTNMSDDRGAQQLWSQQIVTLADEYRLNNQFLEAGRMYALAGSESNNWEDRAETLYKGGLLLYRAGRREEAIRAFEQASQDGNNQFYANLAQERLTRLLQ